ncbi:MAG: hypothetical protein Q9M36_10575 [Sulfurovum sp.]|nr:hypothetical protein [Sulfurovum sp.]
MNKAKIKSIAYFLGKTLGFLGLIFVFYTLAQEYTLASFTQQFIAFLAILPLLIVLNIISVLIGIYAWHQMLLHYSSHRFEYMLSYYYFSKTEIAKYLPGNIFHFIGRQALASKLDITQKHMAQISLLFALLLLTGTLITGTAFAFLSQAIPLFILTLLGISSIISLMSLGYIYPSFPLSKKVSMHLYLALSIAMQGIMLGIIVMYQSEAFGYTLFFQCVSIYTISWLIGFVTPGASGGLGVREGVFIAIVTYLAIQVDSNIIIFSVLLVRLINISVDVLLYLWTFILENKIKEVKI